MATHSSVLAWRIPGTGEPGGLPSMGVTQSQTQLKRLSSSSSKPELKAQQRFRGEAGFSNRLALGKPTGGRGIFKSFARNLNRQRGERAFQVKVIVEARNRE